jgi:PilZ domain
VDQVANAIAAAMQQQQAATQEIARSIEQSAQSNREVSSKIASVSLDAEQLNLRASEVQHTIAGAADSVASLRSILVRVVRNSSEDTNRRTSERYQVDIGAVVECSGRTIPSRILDISEGGAKITCVPSLEMDAVGKITIEGMRQSIGFVVRGGTKESAEIALEGDIREQYLNWLSRLTGSRAAA